MGPPWALLGAWGATAFGLAALGSAAGVPAWCGKRADGTHAWWSLAALAPYHLVVRLLAAASRASQPAFTEIHPGWWVGGWPHRPDLFAPWPAIVDLTCELPRRGPADAYHLAATWDATAPSPETLTDAVAFALAHRAAGRPVLFHCAHGRGRSVAALIAALVAAGLHADFDEACAHVDRKRRVAMTRSQRAAVRRWLAAHGPRPEASGLPVTASAPPSPRRAS